MLREVVSGIVITLLSIVMLTSAFSIQPVMAYGTIYIRADGSVDPPTAPIHRDVDVYTLTSNISSDAHGIVIERNDMTLDGADFTLRGSEAPYSKGIYLNGTSNVTIKNVCITDFYYGVLSKSVYGSHIRENCIKGNEHGIHLCTYNYSSNNSISRNSIVDNSGRGIGIYGSSNYNSIFENNITGNGDGIYLYDTTQQNITGNLLDGNQYGFTVTGFTFTGYELDDYLHHVATTNLVNGRPIYYLVNEENLEINSSTCTEMGFLAIVNSTNVTIKNQSLTGNRAGLLLVCTNKSRIIGNDISENMIGIGFVNCWNNTICRNTIACNTDCGITIYGVFPSLNKTVSSNNNICHNNVTHNWYGISLSLSRNDTIFENNISSNGFAGVMLSKSSGNTISANKLTANDIVGIDLSSCSHNYISNNNVEDNHFGIILESYSVNNTICGNEIVDNLCGIWISHSLNNTIYHNNIVANTLQIESLSGNHWDNGCEGNYWSNYNGTDFDGDGIGDEYLPWEGEDYYPLMNLYWNPCDINHDLKINMRDVGRAAKANGTEPGDIRWNGHADITGPEYLIPNNKVDMTDIALIARNFGKESP